MAVSLARASRMRGDAGEKLPDVFAGFVNAGVHLRRGQVSLVVAAPGVGKSTVALTVALLARCPTLYQSADTDAHTTCVRVVQAAALVASGIAEQAVLDDGPLARQALSAVDWVQFDFPSSPTVDEITERTWAYAEKEGRYPHLIVVDNLMDVDREGEGEGEGLNRVMDDMKKLAQRTEAHVMVLHHSLGEYEDGDKPIPLSGLRYKVGKNATLVLTIANGQANQVWVSVVKNRYGPRDATGYKVRIPLLAQYEVMKVRDWAS